MIEHMATAIALPRFNDLGRSVTLHLLWLRKIGVNEENLSTRGMNILKNAPSNFVFFVLRLSVRRFQMPLPKTLVQLGINK